MRKVILTSALAILGFGLTGANALETHSGHNAAHHFGFSEQDDLPASLAKRQFNGLDAGIVTSSTSRVTVGYPSRSQFGGTNRIYSAADAFGPSDRNDLPASLSRRPFGRLDVGSVTSSTAAERLTSGYPRRAQFGRTPMSRGYNASDDFAVSDD
ncbi:hypothetical protein [Chelativorans sp. AA-79]|uniref:hypothetical protein n=1 Tax=Chelativorans sp. AA-79 TaxID=3028735 RepID=UPI0023F6BDCD|nr:hypothetical protein [Chelativorans sp. AA-79]WEX11108.1 hypothetical protein PVE73_09325 [Chelativorans sp. AA-79]